METINSLPFNANPQPGIAGSDKLHALFTGLDGRRTASDFIQTA
ncbi:hypothetical protein [Bacteroides heparinolyticus]